MSPESGSSAVEPRAQVDEAFSSLTRLKVAAFLSGCDEAEFAAISRATTTTASALSKAATTLENAGYATIKKGHIGRRPRTWLSLSPAGRAAFSRHLQALEDLTTLARADPSTEGTP